MPAANQYGNNFETTLYRRYGKTARVLMQEMRDSGLSYHDAATQTGFAIPTIRKWARRYGIFLNNMKHQRLSAQTKFQISLNTQELNTYNCLSRPWR